MFLDGQTTAVQVLIDTVIQSCNVNGCIGIKACDRCRRLSYVSGSQGEVSESDIFSNVRDLDDILVLLKGVIPCS